ncbi:MAG: DEAD/DEAH box helicase [Gallionella sp.]|nr:DEAD/DEAH box helicase [Gallionella sp.]
MDVFNMCSEINDCFENQKESQGREQLIKMLDYLKQADLPYTPLVNRMIRRSGLYPYLKTESATWEDRCVYDAFKVDIGLDKPITLHREQSSVLKKLIDGKDLAISAPTSFGKSFIIDAFIAIKQPKNVMIIVPTLALTDETRRRLQRKFSREYKIITTSDVAMGDKNIFVFPQERAIHYANSIQQLDLLVIDEFYKASVAFDKERSPALLRAMLRLSAIAKQRYFLAPNVSSLKTGLFTKGMEFTSIDFNTVFLEKHELFQEMKIKKSSTKGDEKLKGSFLVDLLKKADGKTLVYAGSYPNIANIATLLIKKLERKNCDLLNHFSKWLAIHYGENWDLTNLVKLGVGIHNGQIHRSLSQIQIKLFGEVIEGLNVMVSTSSIIEGVNTSAENIVLWSNKNGNPKINDFTYRNIIGRGGRMFQHFVGKIYILEEPPVASNIELELLVPDAILGNVDEKQYAQDLTQEQVESIIAYKMEMRQLLGVSNIEELYNSNALQTSDSNFIRDMARDISKKPNDWNGLLHLNSDTPEEWERLLYKLIQLRSVAWGFKDSQVVAFVKVISHNWKKTIPEMLKDLKGNDISLDDFFKLERVVTNNFAPLLNDLTFVHRKVVKSDVDVSPFIAKISCAFLPPVVFKLEEYGLPRMISKKIHRARLIDFTNSDLTLHTCIDWFINTGVEKIKNAVPDFDSFDLYVLDHFFEGIQVAVSNNEENC